MVFKPSSLAPSQGWSSFFQGIISGDWYMVFKLSAVFRLAYLEMDIWFWSHHFWHLYRDGSAVFWVSSPVMGLWFSRVVFLEVFPWFSKHLYIYRYYTAVFRLAYLEMDIWFSCHHLWLLYWDDAAVFRVSSLKMDIWFSSLHPWRLYREDAAFFGTWLSIDHLWRLNRNVVAFLSRHQRRCIQAIISDTFTKMVQLFSVYHLWRWILGYQGYHLCTWFSSHHLLRISGDGHMVFKP